MFILNTNKLLIKEKNANYKQLTDALKRWFDLLGLIEPYEYNVYLKMIHSDLNGKKKDWKDKVPESDIKV